MAKRKQQNKFNRVGGIHAVEALLRSKPEACINLHLLSGRDDARIQAIADLAQQFNIPTHIVARQQLDKLLPDIPHQGVIAETKTASLWQESDLEKIVERAGEHLLLLVLDGIQDPHNLGACLRTANAAGVHAVIAPRDKAVGITPVVSKVASGAAELTPFVQVTNLSRTLRQLKTQGIWFIGTSDQASTDIYASAFDRPIAVVLGAEGKGLRHLTQELCDELVRIPMLGQVESLNVSVATGVCLYEVLRQRSLLKP